MGILSKLGFGGGHAVCPSKTPAIRFLNRVPGQNALEILGNLVSNARVFLVNRAGIWVGRDGMIDTGGARDVDPEHHE